MVAQFGGTREEHPRTPLSSASYLQAAMEHTGPVAHAPEPQAVDTAGLVRDTRAVVIYLQEERIPVTPVPQPNIPRPTVRQGVVDAFLGGAVEVRCHLNVVNIVVKGTTHVEVHIGMLADLFGERSECGA